MSGEKKVYRAQILGTPYTLVSDEPEESVWRAISLVDGTLSQAATHGHDTQKATVLACIRMANQLLALQDQLKDVQSRSEALLKRLDKAFE